MYWNMTKQLFKTVIAYKNILWNAIVILNKVVLKNDFSNTIG
jgi:hypothetical protein